MAELEEKLNAILSDPQAMGQILSAAKALSGAQEEEDTSSFSADDPSNEEAVDPLSALNQLDPRLIQAGMRLLSEYTAGDDRKTALLEALKPFLRQERQAKVDQAVRIARLARVIRTAFRIFQERGKEESEDV